MRAEYLNEYENIKREREEEEARDREYTRTLVEQELREQAEQERLDREAAFKLQEEEVGNLGVTLASPSEEQRKLLELYRPKSPIRLGRGRTVDPSSKRKKLKTIRIRGNPSFSDDK